MSIDKNPNCPFIQRFAEDLKLSGKSPRTQQSYCRALRKFIEFLGHSPEQATHTLRHCYATHLLEAGVNLKLIQKYMGHKHLTSTMIYLHVTTVGEEAAIAKINALMKRKGN